MRAKLPVIKPASDIKPHTFNVGEDSLTDEDVVRIQDYYWREWHIDWKDPRKVIVVESSRDIPKLMEEAPIGKQAIVTKGGR